MVYGEDYFMTIRTLADAVASYDSDCEGNTKQCNRSDMLRCCSVSYCCVKKVHSYKMFSGKGKPRSND